MTVRPTFAAVAMAFVLSGCATTVVEEIPPRDYSNMYIIANFTWWEADENYRLLPVQEGLYAAKAKLIADGQPYDFKFADKNWTPGYSCGSPYGSESLTLALAEKVEADCFNPRGNFKFTPEQTGTYQFFIDFSDEDEPEVYIQRTE